jgi:hypothetical protein
VADGLFSSDYGLALVKATAALQPCFESLFYSIDIYCGLALNILSIIVLTLFTVIIFFVSGYFDRMDVISSLLLDLIACFYCLVDRLHKRLILFYKSLQVYDDPSIP